MVPGYLLGPEFLQGGLIAPFGGRGSLWLLVAGPDALPFNARPRGAALAAAAGLGGTYSVARPRERAAVAAVLVDGGCPLCSRKLRLNIEEAHLAYLVAWYQLISQNCV